MSIPAAKMRILAFSTARAARQASTPAARFPPQRASTRLMAHDFGPSHTSLAGPVVLPKPGADRRLLVNENVHAVLHATC